jgi:cell division protein FtsB
MTQAAHANLTELVGKIVNLLRLLVILAVVLPCILIAYDHHEKAAYRAEAELHGLAQENVQLHQEIQALHAELSASHAALFVQQHQAPEIIFNRQENAPPVEIVPDGKGGWMKKGFEHPPEKST